MQRSITLETLFSLLTQRDWRNMIGGSQPLSPREYAGVSPIILDESGNLIDGWRRIGGLAGWCRENCFAPSRISIQVMVIPLELGEGLWGEPLDDDTVAELIRRYWE